MVLYAYRLLFLFHHFLISVDIPEILCVSHNNEMKSWAC